MSEVVENANVSVESNVTVDEPIVPVQQPQPSITMSGVANTACNALITAAAGMVLNIVGGALVTGTHKIVGAAGGWIQHKKQERKERKALKALAELDNITDPDEGDTDTEE